MWQMAYSPWPPLCLTLRPRPLALPPMVSRSGTRSSDVSTATPYRLVSRSSSTSAWASPMHHSTCWWVSALFSRRSVGSSATSRAMAWAILSSSALDLALTATGQQRLGHRSRAPSAAAVPCWTACRRSRPCPAWPRRRCPRPRASVTGRCCLPSGQVSAPTRSSVSWSAWPCSTRPCPDTCTAASTCSVPENTRTRLTRPTYGSEVVLTTSASSGPAGSQDNPLHRAAVECGDRGHRVLLAATGRPGS